MPKAYFRESWTSPWVEQPYVYLRGLTRSLNPSLDQAVCEYDFGMIGRPDVVTRQVYAPISLANRFVKLEVETLDENGAESAEPTLWHGYVVREPKVDGGVLVRNGQRVPTGMTQFQCLGLDYLLARWIIHSSVVDQAGGRYIGRGIPFNERSLRTHKSRGNRSKELGPDGVYLFASRLSDAEEWDGLSILDYLLKYQLPVEQFGEEGDLRFVVPFTLRRNGQEEALRNFKTELPQEGTTVKALLDRLFDRRRMLGYKIEVTPAEEEGGQDLVEIVPVSFAKEDLAVASDYFVPANLWPKAVDVDFSPLIDELTYSQDVDARYDQVVIYGAERTSTGTFGYKDLVWDTDWLPGVQAVYDDGASLEASYSTLDYAERARLNSIARSQARFERVYRWFRIKPTWDGKLKDGDNTGSAKPFFPVLDGAGQPTDEVSVVWLPGLRFEPRLRLLGDYDYETTLGDDTPDETPDDGAPDRRAALALIKLPGSGLYARLEKLPADEPGQLYSTGDTGWSAFVRPQEHAFGIIVDVHGRPQHALAKGVFAPLGSEDPDADLDYRDNLLVTLTAKQDERVVAIYPPTQSVPLPSILEIELGEDFRLDYVAPQTIVDLDAGGSPVRNVSGGFLRDDREKLQFLARLVYEWYAQPRRVLQMSYKSIGDSFFPGQLLTTLGGEETETELNTVVTEVRWDWPEQGAPTTSIVTAAGELDLLAIRGGLA